MSLLGLLIIIVSILVLIVVSGFLSGSETAFLSVNRIKVKHLVKQNQKKAILVQKLIDNIDQLISTILISNNFVNVAISSLAAATFYYFLGPKLGIMTSTVVMTIIILIFSEITPKILAAKYSKEYAFKVASVMTFIVKILSPLSFIFTNISSAILKLTGGSGGGRPHLVTEEEIRTMIEVGREEGAVEDEEREMLHRIFDFGDIEISQVMIPRDKIVAADINMDIRGFLDLVVREGYARLPVYEDEFDNIIGVMYARDLLKIWQNSEKGDIRELVRPAYLVAPNKKARDLLDDFQRKRIQIAIVVDDNKVLGLVSLEDLVEEIVGEIEDWHD